MTGWEAERPGNLSPSQKVFLGFRRQVKGDLDGLGRDLPAALGEALLRGACSLPF